MTPTTDRLLPLPAVREIVGLGKTKIYDLVKTGQFPQPARLGGTRTLWSEREIGAWVEGVLAQREAV